jgi:uncharacterized membrane protein YgdD (TMEM256/DUF423 family)
MSPKFIYGTGLNGAIAVAMGAFGAHGLKHRLNDAGMLSAWETAAQYHLAHAIACVGVLAWASTSSNRANRLRWPVFFWLFGCLLFSGSLYWLALGGPRILGPVTPLGGLAFIIGWGLIAKEGFHKAAP